MTKTISKHNKNDDRPSICTTCTKCRYNLLQKMGGPKSLSNQVTKIALQFCIGAIL